MKTPTYELQDGGIQKLFVCLKCMRNDYVDSITTTKCPVCGFQHEPTTVRKVECANKHHNDFGGCHNFQCYKYTGYNVDEQPE